MSTEIVHLYENSCTGRKYMYFDTMKATEIINLFGGIRPLAKVLGHKHPSTVQNWYERNAIPKWRHHEVLAASRSKRLGLTEADLGAAK